MSKMPKPTLRYPELGLIFRAKRIDANLTGGQVAREVLGDPFNKFKIYDIEKGAIRSTAESLRLIEGLVAFYLIEEEELEKIDYEGQFAKIREEITARIIEEQNEALLPITKPSRYDPRP